MKKFHHFFVLAFIIVLTASSCQKTPSLTLMGNRSFSFSKDGGSQNFALSTNMDWTVSCSETWCRVSPSSGFPNDGEINVTISVDRNSSSDERNCILTIKVNGLSETVSVSQEAGSGLIVSPTTVELTNAAQTIEIKVQKNVPYSILIDDAGKDWIKHTGTRSLNSEVATFSVSANTEYDSREGKINFKQDNGSLMQTVIVRQSQTNGLFITTPEYNLSNEAHTLSVEVKSNVQFEVTSEADWIKYIETKALTPSTIVLSVLANESNNDRIGKVFVKQINGDLTGTITINQNQAQSLIVTPTSFDLSKYAQTVQIEVKNNVPYNVVIPDNAKNWISIQSDTQTRSLTNDVVTLSIARNPNISRRESSITIKQIDGPLAETVTIKQANWSGVYIEKTVYDVSCEEQELPIEYEYKQQFSFKLVDNSGWIGYRIVGTGYNPRVTLLITANNSYKDRSGTVDFISGKDTTTITINQAVNYGVGAFPSLVSITKEEQTFDVVVKSNVDYDVIIPEDAKDWLSIVQTRAYLEEAYSFLAKVNTTGNLRNADVLFKRRDNGDISMLNVVQTGDEAEMIDGYLVHDDMSYSFISTEELTIQLVKANKTCPSVVSVPSHLAYKGKLLTVIWIAKDAFKDQTTLQKIIIPNSINTIDNAFSGCKGLKEFVLKDGESDIMLSSSLFIDCPLEVVYQGRNVYLSSYSSAYSSSPFNNKPYLSSITFSKNVTCIPKEYLRYCSELKSLMLPDSIKEIEYRAFQYSGIKEIILPSQLVLAGSEFLSYTYIEKIILPESLKEISSYAFRDCRKLNEIHLKGVESISTSAFKNCSNIRKIFCYTSTPPSFVFDKENTVFSSTVLTDATLYVPKGSLEEYKNANEWNKFWDIVEMP